MTVIDGKLACDCGTKYDLNPDTKTCEPKKLCTKGGIGRNECVKLNAMCELDDMSEKGYNCICPPGTIFDNTTCINICEFENRNKICEDLNAECNPMKLQSFDPFDGKKPAKFCDCLSGFMSEVNSTSDELKCLIGKHVAQFNLTINKNSFPVNDLNENIKFVKYENLKFYANLTSFAQQYKSINEENFKIQNKTQSAMQIKKMYDVLVKKLSPILRLAGFNTNHLDVEKCDTVDNYMKCTFNLYLSQPLKKKNIGEKLKEICLPVPNQSQDCILLKMKNYYYDYENSTDYEFILNKEDLSKSTLVYSEVINEEKL